MSRKLLGIFTSITAALLVVGMAWAGDDAGQADDDSHARITGETSLEASAETQVSATGDTLPTGSSTSITSGSSPSTSMTSPGSSSTTTVTSSAGSSTSVTTGEGSSTSLVTRTELTSSAGGTFQVPDAGSVTVEVHAGLLVLTDVSAPGWDIRIKDVRHDRVRIEFRKDGAKAEFEARLDSGRLDIEIRRS